MIGHILRKAALLCLPLLANLAKEQGTASLFSGSEEESRRRESMRRTFRLLGLCAGALIAVAPFASAQNILGANTSGDLFEISPFAGTVVNTIRLTLPGETVRGANGLSRNPETAVLYAILQLQGDSGRELVTVNETTGVCTSVGSTGIRFSGITFTRHGTLYAVSGEGASPSETLYTLSLVTGAPTFALTLGNGGDGEAIAYSPAHDRIYHASGFVDLPAGDFLNNLATGQIFESIDVSGTPTLGPQVFLSGASVNEVGGLVENGKFAFFATDRQNNNVTVITDTGFRTQVSSLNVFSVRGLAFVRPDNDDCSAATVIGTGSFSGTLLGATNDGDTPCGIGEDTSPDIWFSYTAPADGMLTVDTGGTHDFFGTDSGVDTVLSVHSGCPGDVANTLACDDDSAFGTQMGLNRDSIVQVALTATQTVMIRVANYNAGLNSNADVHTGRINLNTSFVADGPVYPNHCNGDRGNQLGCTNCPCFNNAVQGTIGGCLNSTGASTAILVTGDASASLPPGIATDLRISLSGAPPNAFCVMLSGSALAPTNNGNPCFGMGSGVQSPEHDGLRCAVMNLKRHGGRSASAFGAVLDSSGPSRVWGGEAQPTAGLVVQGGFASGQTRYFQATYRVTLVPGCGTGLNTSQAVEVLVAP